MSKPNDKQLVKQMQAGDQIAFAQFVDAFGPLVLKLARRYASCEADAEDLTQDIFVALCRGIGNFRGEAQLSTWVYRVALNHCLKAIERRGRAGETVEIDTLPLVADTTHAPHQAAARQELSQKVDAALATLPPGQRETVILHEMHGLTYAECAAVMGIPVGTVKSRLSGAFGRLRDRLGNYVLGEEEEHLSLAPAGFTTVAGATTTPRGTTL